MNNQNLYNEIGKLIKKERKKKGITQEKLADLSNYSHSFIANIESNTFQSFSIDTLYHIAKSLDTSIHNLIPEKEEIEEKEYKLICNNCNYNVSIPKEIGKILTIIKNISTTDLYFTCPKCNKRKVRL